MLRGGGLSLWLALSFFWLGGSVGVAIAQPTKTDAQRSDFKVGLAARGAVEARLQATNASFFASRYLPEKKKAYPLVVFVPGILGSKLERVDPQTQQREVLWGTISASDLFVAQSIAYTDGQAVEASTLHSFNAIGFKADIYGEGLAFISKQYFSEVKTLIAFAYDWRQDNERSGDQLRMFLCTNAAAFQDRSVVFVAHSMGGLVLKSWFIKHYNNGALQCGASGSPSTPIQVAEVIFLGTPHMGSPKAIKAFADGFQLVNDDKTLFGSLFGKVDKNTLAKALNAHGATFPSVYQLLPAYGWDGCLSRVADEPPDPILVNANGSVHNKFDLFSASAWRRVGWPKYLPSDVNEKTYYNTVLPAHLARAKEFLCQVARYKFPPAIPVTYFYGQDKDATTDQTFILDNIAGDGEERGSSILRHKEGGFAWGDGTVLSSIAMNSWYSSHRDRHFAPSLHGELLKSRPFLEYAKSIIDSAQAQAELALIATPEGKAQLLATYSGLATFAMMPRNAMLWNEPRFTVVQEFNTTLLEQMRIDVKNVIAVAEKKNDDRAKGSLLAVAATVKGVSPLQRAKAAEAVAMAQFALGDWAGASDTVGATTTLAQAVESKQQRETILRSAYRTGGWASIQLGQTEKGTGYLLNAQRLGNSKAFNSPTLQGYTVRHDTLGGAMAHNPGAGRGG